MEYASGVFSDSSYTGQTSNHDVLTIGYGTYIDKITKLPQDYFLIMSMYIYKKIKIFIKYFLLNSSKLNSDSWGDVWGLNGTVMVARNKNFMINIGTDGNYPLIDTTYTPSNIGKLTDNKNTHTHLLKIKQFLYVYSNNTSNKCCTN
jgi:hypothetical protein